jgi:hypothetical protein
MGKPVSDLIFGKANWRAINQIDNAYGDRNQVCSRQGLI